MNYPEDLFDRDTEDLIIDLDSKVILEAHLQCAGHEMPLTGEDEEYFGPLTKEICETRLRKDKDGWYHTHPKFLPFPASMSQSGVLKRRNTASLTSAKWASPVARRVSLKRSKSPGRCLNFMKALWYVFKLCLSTSGI